MDLSGRNLLLVEDEYFIVQDMVRAFEAAGASIVGPASNVAEAISLIGSDAKIDGAVLDINLQGEMAFQIADMLMDHGIPFVFATGYGSGVIHNRYSHIERCEKPVEPDHIGRALLSCFPRYMPAR